MYGSAHHFAVWAAHLSTDMDYHTISPQGINYGYRLTSANQIEYL